MKKYVLLFLISSCVVSAQETPVQLLGLRVYAYDDEYMPPIVAAGQKITIEFDVAAVHPPDLRVRFVHATKDWVPENNSFLNETIHTVSQPLQFVVAANGVHHYSYHYNNAFPDERGNVLFPYSGNYVFTVVDHDAGDVPLANGRFIVVEHAVGTTMTVDNKYYAEQTAPYNQMHYISVAVSVPQFDASADGSVNHMNVKTVDVIKNWEMSNPYRIDIDDKNPDTFVEEFYSPNKKFKIRDVSPGNEYRRLDIGSPRFYPNEQPVRLKEGADLVRMYWQGKIDANGASKLRPFTGANSDYLDVEFRLEVPSAVANDVYLVGAFNQWEPSPATRMIPDSTGRYYSLHQWIRRGVYDYQYVVGRRDPSTGEVVDQDWLMLEGNDWRTINRYTALVYYHDDRFGGFDRVVGSAIAKSPGGTAETSSATSGQ